MKYTSSFEIYLVMCKIGP